MTRELNGEKIGRDSEIGACIVVVKLADDVIASVCYFRSM